MQKLNRTEMAHRCLHAQGILLTLAACPATLERLSADERRPPPIPPEQQEARLQGVMTISHYLESLGEPGWRGVLLQWLGRYDGIEVMFPEEDPVLAVQELLGAYRAGQVAGSRGIFLPSSRICILPLSRAP